ncbi:MAG: hypothetical protein IT384_35140 [Deltaproteobacteria bacterium]|nr:hypothetical protein [Deltaproteobacteria bacterium]
MRLPKKLKWVFWEVDFDDLDSEEDADYILGRILEFSRLAEVQWAIATYGMDRIHHFFRESGDPELSERTIQFWRAVFRAEKEPWRSPPAWRKTSSVPWVS